MPFIVSPKYIDVLRERFLKENGRKSTLDEYDISELVNVCYSSRRLTEDEEVALTVAAMLDKERSVVT